MSSSTPKAVVAPDNVDNVYVLSMGGYQFVMPVEDAVIVMKHLSKAKKFDAEYITGGTYKYHLGGALPSVEIKLLSADNYYEGLINGPRL